MTEIEQLKAKADELGVDYAGNIGAEKLKRKIEDFLNQKAKGTKKKPKEKKLSDVEVKILKAKNLIKVRISNLDPNNVNASTVFSGIVNSYMSLQRVIPLNIPIAVEEALVKDIEKRQYISSVPEEDNNGNITGNMKTVQLPVYAVVRL